jgi:sigma-B regulation protein RsbU (phosphoserine phosphatase)
MSPVDEQLRAVLGSSLASLAIGIVITSISLFAIAEHFRRGRSKSRLLLWFGLFAGLYGVRVLGRAPAVRLMLSLPDEFWAYLAASADYVIMVPAFLFWEEIYGRGWKSSTRWLVWAGAGYASISVTLSVVLHRPYVLPEPGGAALIAIPAFLIGNYLLGYRPPAIAEAKALMLGLGVFMACVVNSHLGRWQLSLAHSNPEPFGFLFFLCCLGWIAAHRFRTNEQELLSLAEEMKAARRIQESILPSSIPNTLGLEVAVRYSPMTAVAGDFYDFLAVDAHHLGLLVADVAGHGVPAALGAAMVKVAFSTQAANASDPALLIAGLNDTMHRLARGQFTTAGFLSFDMHARAATYAAAGHPPLLLWRPSTGTLREFKENGVLLGVLPNQAYVNMRFDILSGDRIFMCTDGVWEAENGAGEVFGDARLERFIRDHGHQLANEVAGALLADVNSWSNGSRGQRQSDDITVAVIAVN